MRPLPPASDPVMMLSTAPSPRVGIAARLPYPLASAIALALGFAVSAWIAGLGPLESARGEPSASDRTMRAMPFDAPVPAAAPDSAGEGADLPYRAEWTLPDDPGRVIDHLTSEIERLARWRITLERDAGAAYEITLIRVTAEGMMTHFARITVSPGDVGGSRMSFDFIPMADLGPARLSR